MGLDFHLMIQDARDVDKITWTRSMCRLYFLVERCYKLREPVLLVGETGGGKTTVCQLLSLVLHSKLRILNCHQYTEASDFIGVCLLFALKFELLPCALPLPNPQMDGVDI